MRSLTKLKNYAMPAARCLVGTTSVEVSELLSRMLAPETNSTHNVLNAKQHAREAQIVAEAGMPVHSNHCHQHGRPWYGYQAWTRCERSRRIGNCRYGTARKPSCGQAVAWSCRSPGRPGIYPVFCIAWKMT